MADDLDALFGAFDGGGPENDAENDAVRSDEGSGDDKPTSKRRRLDDDDGGDGEEDGEDNGGNGVTDGGEMDTANGDGEPPASSSAGSKAKAVSSMYADVFSSMDHAVGHVRDKKKPTGDAAPSSSDAASGDAAAPPTNGTAGDAAAAEENREVSTGTSHDKSIRSYSALPDGPPAPGSSSAAADEKPDDRPPAKTYPFPLDPFQSTAIGYVESNQSVLVAAHTSAGKTVVAEYAIAKSLRDGQRVVYTSPIKALSNQKYRDLAEEFEDVGLMTGDITINPGATCLVMTTEILRSMLYRGSEVMREVAWVIYDEVHYMRDKERGVVWEESIILLPHKVRFVFLSATIPNARQFVSWIAKIHHQPCHVVYTNYRPTPLQHYVFPQGADGLHLVVDEKGKFREANFQRAMSTLQGGGSAEQAVAESVLDSGARGARGGKRKQRGGGPKGQSNDLHRIVKLIMTRNLNPVIVFSFSKKDCEKYALELKREDYTDDTEKELISQVYSNAIESLSDDDKKLPQVEALLPLLKRGLGVHHGGLLPILKEIVEILFSEGLIKALFATETFAIGINMPAKTVVFTNTRKWDGKEIRWVTSGEYIQMSGRAGRRGKDDRGVVIQMMDEKMEPAVCKGILYGDPDPLNSSYRISYNMLLNMLRVEDVDPEYLLRASFHQYQQESEAPALEAQADQHDAEAQSIEVVPGGTDEDVALVGEYFGMDRQLLLTQRKMIKVQRRPEHILPFVQSSGRLIDVTIDGENYGWGVIVRYKRKAGTGTAGSAGQAAVDAAGGSGVHTIDVLLSCVDRHFDDTSQAAEARREEDLANLGLLWRGTVGHCRPAGTADGPEVVSMREFTVGLDSIDRISAVRLFVPQDAKPPEARRNIMKSLKEVRRRFPDGLPLLDPVKDLKINVGEFDKLLQRASELKERLASHRLATEVDEAERNRRVSAYERRQDESDKARLLRREARACQTMVMKDELRRMKRVLKELGHVDAAGVIQTKGRTACEINTANELVVVELVFAGLFNDLSVEQAVALLSCLIFDERTKDDDDPAQGLKSYLSNPYYKLIESAKKVAKVMASCNIEVNEDEFVEKFNPGL